MPAPFELVSDRYELREREASGGMGTVWRAWDRRTQRVVACKLVAPGAVGDAARFEREVAVLRTLAHPALVALVDDGTCADGRRFLVTDWVEGESLAARIARGPLEPEQAVSLGAALARALAYVHGRGVVHRDIKPANVLLDGGDVARPRLVDFGIAQQAARGERRLTQTGLLIGSIPYVAPERAAGQGGVGGRADVFALGCLLFECLTGRRAYDAPSTTAVLAKIVWDEPPSVRALRPSVPDGLARTIAWAMTKRADERPDASELAQRLAVLAERGVDAPTPRERAPIDRALAMLLGGDDGGDERTTGSLETTLVWTPAGRGLTDSEQRMLWVVAADGIADIAGESIDDAETTAVGAASGAAAIVASFGGVFHLLADGVGLAVLAVAGPPTDGATRAARCALALRDSLGVRVAVGADTAATGSAPVGEAAQRAIAALEHATVDAPRLSELGASLLDGSFDVTFDARGALLGGELSQGEARRRLLGRGAPLVGRERELALLERMLDEAVEERTARAVVVLAPPGVGKSRLRDELVHRVETAGTARVRLGRGDSLRQASAFAVIGDLVGEALASAPGPDVDRVARLARRVWEVVDEPLGGAARMRSILAELVGAPSSAVQAGPGASRSDARLVGDRVRVAFVDWLAGECAAGPVLLVVEDAHWADAASLACIGAAVERAADAPLLVLILARDDGAGRIAAALRDVALSQIHLAPLARRAALALVRRALGAGADDAVVDRIVERAEGNAFHLEELVRATAEGRAAALPETVSAMLLARLDRLDPRDRRLLRAASVLGRGVGADALAVLTADDAADIERRLVQLADAEFLTLERGPDGGRFVFRHALLRDAVYQSLTPSDRALGHLLAGRWLRDRRGVDQPARDHRGAPAAVVAEHLERGGAPLEAVAFWSAAAREALEANDLEAVVAHVGAAARCGAAGAELGELHVLDAVARAWLGRYDEAIERARRAIDELPRAGDGWLEAVGVHAEASGRHGDASGVQSSAAWLLALGPRGPAPASRVVASARVALQLYFLGLEAEAAELSAWVAAHGELHDDPSAVAWVHRAREVAAALHDDTLGELAELRAAAASFEKAGDGRSAGMQRANAGCVLTQLGAFGEAIGELERALAAADRLSNRPARLAALHNLGPALAGLGRLAEAREAASRALELAIEQGDRRLECGSRAYLARILADAGELGAAADEAERARRMAAARPLRVLVRSISAWIDLLAGRPAGAVGHARDAVAAAAGAALAEGEALGRLVLAASLHATGDPVSGRAALVAACSRILAHADRLGSSPYRAAFLAISEHEKTFDLARRWNVEAIAGTP